jgi:hypothetical protein
VPGLSLSRWLVSQRVSLIPILRSLDVSAIRRFKGDFFGQCSSLPFHVVQYRIA